jgi:prepilin-type N-terminal cleavage/methylation domain-containing protein
MNPGAKGFTLVELLIVIGIVVILSVAVVLTLNPAELLRQARDSTRISDMNTIKSSLALFQADTASTSIVTSIGNCYVHSASGITSAGCGGRFPVNMTPATSATTSNSSSQSVAGQVAGWIPVNLSAVTAGAPISAWPIDPTNNTSYFYAYAVTTTNGVNVYEINAVLESTKYTATTNYMTSDGGSTSTQYEVGTGITSL